MINTDENALKNVDMESKRNNDAYIDALVEYEYRRDHIEVPDDLIEWSRTFLMDQFMENPHLAKIYRENYPNGVAVCRDRIAYLTVPIVSNPELNGVVLTDEKGNDPFHFGMDTLISLLMLFGTYEVLNFKILNSGNHCPQRYEALFHFLESKPGSYKFLRKVYNEYQRDFRKHKEFHELIEKYFGPLPDFDIYG